MNTTEWEELAAWVEARWPKQWHPEQHVAYYDDLQSFDASDVWTALYAVYNRGTEFAPKGSTLKAGAITSRRQAALDERYDNAALPAPVEEKLRPIGSWLEKWYPDEQVTWTEHIRRVHEKGRPCKSRLCDIHNADLAKEET